MTTARSRPNRPSSSVSSSVALPSEPTENRRRSSSLSVLTTSWPSQSRQPATRQERRARRGEGGRSGRPRRRQVLGGRPAAVGDRPGRIGAGEARVAVVAAGLEVVDLVVLIGAVLDLPDGAVRPEGEALRVAMAQAVDGDPERVVGRDRSVEVEAQHLAVEPIRILRAVLAGGQVGVADAQPEVIGRIHLDRASLVARRAGDLADGHDLERCERAVVGRASSAAARPAMRRRGSREAQTKTASSWMAMPMSPDSSSARTSGIVVVGRSSAFGSPLAKTSTRPMRSVTSMRPSSAKAMSHGCSRPSCTPRRDGSNGRIRRADAAATGRHERARPMGHDRPYPAMDARHGDSA